MTNLFANAVKYVAPRITPRICVTTRPGGRAAPHLVGTHGPADSPAHSPAARFAGHLRGYADCMSDSAGATTEGNRATKPGPANPAPRGMAAPTPPGGPQRQDAADTGPRSDGPQHRGSDRPDDHSPGAGTIPLEDEQPHPERATSPGGATGQQQEHAGTSLHEPSVGIR